MPEAPGPGDATPRSPFKEALDADAIIKNLVLDRPLSLYVPDRHLYPDYQFRFINNISREVADAHNKGWREVTDPKLCELFQDLTAGSDKTGKMFRPILMSRPKAVGEHIQQRNRKQLQSLYAGMDPRNKELDGKYTSNVVDGKDASRGQFSGAGWRIRIK